MALLSSQNCNKRSDIQKCHFTTSVDVRFSEVSARCQTLDKQRDTAADFMADRLAKVLADDQNGVAGAPNLANGVLTADEIIDVAVAIGRSVAEELEGVGTARMQILGAELSPGIYREVEKRLNDEFLTLDPDRVGEKWQYSTISFSGKRVLRNGELQLISSTRDIRSFTTTVQDVKGRNGLTVGTGGEFGQSLVVNALANLPSDIANGLRVGVVRAGVEAAVSRLPLAGGASHLKSKILLQMCYWEDVDRVT